MYLSKDRQQRMTFMFLSRPPTEKDFHVSEQRHPQEMTSMYLNSMVARRINLHVLEQRSPTGGHGPRHTLLRNRTGVNLSGGHCCHHRPDLTTSLSPSSIEAILSSIFTIIKALTVKYPMKFTSSLTSPSAFRVTSSSSTSVFRAIHSVGIYG